MENERTTYIHSFPISGTAEINPRQLRFLAVGAVRGQEIRSAVMLPENGCCSLPAVPPAMWNADNCKEWILENPCPRALVPLCSPSDVPRPGIPLVRLAVVENVSQVRKGRIRGVHLTSWRTGLQYLVLIQGLEEPEAEYLLGGPVPCGVGYNYRTSIVWVSGGRREYLT